MLSPFYAYTLSFNMRYKIVTFSVCLILLDMRMMRKSRRKLGSISVTD